MSSTSRALHRLFPSFGQAKPNWRQLVTAKNRAIRSTRNYCDQTKRCPVFHSFTEPIGQEDESIKTLEDAAKPHPRTPAGITFRYPSLAMASGRESFFLKGIDELDSKYCNFPPSSDFLIIGGGLLGSALSYYLRKVISVAASVTVLDATPDSSRTCTAQSSGTIRIQNLNYKHTRLAGLTMALVRELQNDILASKQDYLDLNLRPCSHLMLWPLDQVETAIEAHEMQKNNGCHIDLFSPQELVSKFPFINCHEDDFALASVGQEGEGTVDPIALRNLYRTLGSAYGCHYFQAEAIDFNPKLDLNSTSSNFYDCSAMVVRLPNGELRHLGFGVVILANGHNIGQLELRTGLTQNSRDFKYKDLLCVRPRVKLNYLFNSQDAPVLKMPVLVDVDGTTTNRRGLGGNFHCVLGPEHHTILSSERTLDLDLNSMRPARLVDDDERRTLERSFESKLTKEFFEREVKPQLSRRVSSFKHAQLVNAWISLDDYNMYDGCPFYGYHPFYNNVLLACGLGDKNTQLAPAMARLLADQALGLESLQDYRSDSHRWNRMTLEERMKDLPY